MKVERHSVNGRLDQSDSSAEQQASGHRIYDTKSDGKVHDSEGYRLGHGVHP